MINTSLQPLPPTNTNSNTYRSDLLAKTGFLGKAVVWHKGDHLTSKSSKIALTILKIIEIALLVVSIVGIILYLKGQKISDKLDSYEIFSKIKANPPLFQKVHFNTKTQCFNHMSYYAIHDGQIWYKEKKSKSDQWQMMYFDGIKKSTPVSIGVDGANLVVVDDFGYVHYKKVIHEESRVVENIKKEIIGIKPYHAWDKSKKDNWKEKWFSLPVIDTLVNMIHGKRLSLPPDSKWAISHRGQYNLYYTDIFGHQHTVSTGVTGLYQLNKNKIYIADPWLPYGFDKAEKIGLDHSIEIPKNFDAQEMAVSASTVFLKGLDTNADGLKEICFYTRLADFDSLARNPFLKYSDNLQSTILNSNIRAKTPEDWYKQPSIILNGLASIHEGPVTIFQTHAEHNENIHEGNDMRELRVPGTNAEGVEGYYYKKLKTDQWQFQVIEDELSEISNHN